MVIGHMYRAFGGGGMPRGTEAILAAQHAMGHDLVVFTREPRGENDFEISVPFRHVVIGDVGIREPSSPERTARLRAAVSESGCDLVIHHEYYARFAIDDLRLFEEMGVPALVQWHSCFSALNMIKAWEGHVLEQIEGVVRHAKGVLTLSRTDKAFFELMGVPAVHVPYSDPDMFDSVPVHGNGHKLLWTGRIVPSKRPVHAVQILEKVLGRFPDATLAMLGDGSRRRDVEEYLAARPELAAHVSLPGFINDVASYLRDADVFLVTTSFEGFMHSLMEAKMAALPTVGYQMDYLDTTRPGTGYCAVPQGDVDAAAEEVCRLLADADERHRLGALARKDFEWFLRLDQKALYNEAFEMALRPRADERPGQQAAQAAEILRILLGHVDTHFLRRLDEFAALAEKLRQCREKAGLCREKLRRRREKAKARKKKLRKLKKKLKALRKSPAYRIGRLVTWPARKLKGLLSRGR
ncbi:MAG: glycosyltransferase family 4 protein [Kiritimatiellae bacterium]|nr:glycosyltransferase family 4 protein [Kiritimatiellia bacterium]